MPDVAEPLASHWMPFTANRDFKAHPRLIVHAEGMVYRSQSGHRVLDGASGLFCCAAGHGRREIADAVSRQLMEMDYAPHFQFGHPSSFELAARLRALLPGDLDHLFFCNSGSEAIDTALKIAMAYHRAEGEGGRQRFVSRERAYHGVNIGGTSLSGILRNREAFPAVMPGVVHMRHTWLSDHRFVRGQPGSGAELAEDLQRFVDLYGASQIAACFVEPIAGSTGVLVPPKGYLERLREICDRAGILLVFDEVICGFGRTGSAFAADSFAVMPDMITMAKALTNGSQPMGAVAVREGIHRALTTGAPAEAIELFHGYTFSAHPAACAAALATLDIYAGEDLFARAARLAPGFLDRMFGLTDIPVITDIRGYGMLAAFDLAPGAAPGARGYAALKQLFEDGLLIKWTGDTGIVAPALIAEERDLDEIEDKLRRVLAAI
ncbi:MAG TPA: aminotransferase class III-fold pyridoxal phosphate-dependent enzyme [Rhodospirillales bacterium]|nr:aminotransferase class III-fold pyridoxal phosphate-dependent enzyme [Rhodospirillales bacterium]